MQGALALALLCALVVLAFSREARDHVVSAVTSRMGVLVGGVFAAWAVTVPFSFDPRGSLKIGGRTALFVASIVLVWAALRPHEQAHRLALKSLVVLAVGLAGLTVLSLVGVPGVLSAMKFRAIEVERPVFAFKAFAVAVMCMLPVVVWAGRRLGGRWRWMGHAFAPLAMAVMLLTYNRSAIAGLLAMGAVASVLLLLTRHVYGKVLSVFVVLSVVGGMAWVHAKEMAWVDEMEEAVRTQGITYTTRGPYVPEWIVDPHRQYIWKFAFDRFLDHPWVGNGIDQLNNLPGANQPVPGLESTSHVMPSHPHNWAFEILAETGLLGFAPMVAALGVLFWTLARRFLATGDEARFAAALLMAGFWASALFSFSIWAVWWQLTFLILSAIVLAGREDAVNG
ncbi:MAG: O-antigen ligase family protein [Alphaproteobacteria bacterium]|nr:O-antigen ligase family protein [Alphaproteobacteria bacterium]